MGKPADIEGWTAEDFKGRSSDDRFLDRSERDLRAAALSLGCNRFDVLPIWYKIRWTAADFRHACKVGWTPDGGWPAAARREF